MKQVVPPVLLVCLAAILIICQGRLLVDPAQVSNSYDFVIIGAGTAGNVLANRLSNTPNVSVLVIEAGTSNIGMEEIIVPGLATHAYSNEPWYWNYTTTPQIGLNNRSFAYPTGRILGGSSSINTMIYTRGSSDDWNRYARVTGEAGWSWTALQPYMKKTESFVQSADHHNTTGQFDPSVHGFNGPLLVSLPGISADFDSMVIQTTRELEEFPFNLDMNSGSTLGIGLCNIFHLFSRLLKPPGKTQSTIGNGSRSSSATAYLMPILNKSNVDVLIQTHATQLLHKPVSKDCTPHFFAVQFAQTPQGDRYQVKATKEIILSAGSINTPRLLMLSGIGDRSELSKFNISTIVDLGDVGKNLSEHFIFSSQWEVVGTAHTFEDAEQDPAVAAAQLAQWQVNATGPLASGPGNQLGWFHLLSNSSIFTNVTDPSAGPASAHFELLFSNGFARPGRASPSTGHYMTVLSLVASPLARGTITLQSGNPFDAPLIDPQCLTTEYDLFVMKEAIKSARRFVTAPVWKDYIVAPVGNMVTTDADLECLIRNESVLDSHPSGTASMSPLGASWGVVDPDLKVKGAKGLRIVDASIFPYLPAAHPQAAVYIAAEYAADLIKSSYSMTDN